MAHGSLGPSIPSCFAPVSALGLPPRRGVVEGRQEQGYGLRGEVLKEKQEGQRRGRRRKRRSTGGEERVKGCGLNPGGSPSHPPFPSLHLPLLPNPSLAACLYTMAASLLKFHVIGSQAWSFVLPQCPGSGACCRGDTLCKLKAGKPFLLSLASKKGRKSPPHPPLFSTTHFPPHFYPASKPEEGCQTQSSFTRHFGL